MAEIYFDPRYCAGCSACSVACIDQNDIDSEKGKKALISVKRTEEKTKGNVRFSYVFSLCGKITNPGLCRGCEDRISEGMLPACVSICPFESLSIRT